MKRILLSVVAVAALALCGTFANTAEAHGPYGRCRTYTNYGYSNYGYGNYGLSGGYGLYGGFTPYNAYRSPYVPYGAGYSGGWQPYNGLYIQQPRFGLQIGF
jgi:hypothetical protein